VTVNFEALIFQLEQYVTEVFSIKRQFFRHWSMSQWFGSVYLNAHSVRVEMQSQILIKCPHLYAFSGTFNPNLTLQYLSLHASACDLSAFIWTAERNACGQQSVRQCA